MNREHPHNGPVYQQDSARAYLAKKTFRAGTVASHSKGGQGATDRLGQGRICTKVDSLPLKALLARPSSILPLRGAPACTGRRFPLEDKDLKPTPGGLGPIPVIL